jgi:hypothetical protein
VDLARFGRAIQHYDIDAQLNDFPDILRRSASP